MTHDAGCTMKGKEIADRRHKSEIPLSRNGSHGGEGRGEGGKGVKRRSGEDVRVRKGEGQKVEDEKVRWREMV